MTLRERSDRYRVARVTFEGPELVRQWRWRWRITSWVAFLLGMFFLVDAMLRGGGGTVTVMYWRVSLGVLFIGLGVLADFAYLFYEVRVYQWGKQAPRCWRCGYQLAETHALRDRVPERCPECGFSSTESLQRWDQWRPFPLLRYLYQDFKKEIVGLYRWFTRRNDSDR